MRSRWTIGLVAVGIVIVGAIILAVTHDPDPVYEGRPLSEWLKAYSPRASDSEREKAKEALSAMGPTALNVMVRWVAYEAPAWRSRMSALAKQLPMPKGIRNWMYVDTREGRAFGAMLGFRAFGPVKTNVGPALVRIANDPSRTVSAGRALGALELFFRDTNFVSQVTNENARQQMRMFVKVNYEDAGANARTTK